MPAQGTMKLSVEAYKSLAHRAIDAEIRPSELLDAIVLYADWEKDLPALVKKVKERQAVPERIPEGVPAKKSENRPESTEVPKVTDKAANVPRERPERRKTQDSLGKFSSTEETRDAEPVRPI